MGKVDYEKMKEFVKEAETNSAHDLAISLSNAVNNSKDEESKEKFWKAITYLLFMNLNSFTFGKKLAKIISANFSHTHPTIQQTFWGMISKIIKDYSETEYFDARNEESVKMCKEIVEKVNSYLPMI